MRYFILFILLSFCSSNYTLRAQAGHTDRIITLVMNKEGKLLSSSNDGVVFLWDENAKKLKTFIRPSDQYSETKLLVTRFAFLNDNNSFMASSLMEGYMGKFDTPMLSSLNTGYMTSFYGLALTSDNSYWLVANNNYTGLTIYKPNYEKYNSIRVVIEDIFPFPKDSKKFITLSSATGINIFDVDGNNILALPLLTKKDPIVISPNEDSFFYKNTLYSIKGVKLYTLPSEAQTICFSPDGNTIYSSLSNKISIWTKEGKLKSVTEYKNPISTFITTPDGSAFVVGDSKGMIEMITTDGQPIFQYK